MNDCFVNYQNSHTNQDAIIFATGPTYFSLDIKSMPTDCIHIGVNGTNARDDIEFDYYFFGDRLSKDGRGTAQYLLKLKQTKIRIQSFAYTNVIERGRLLHNVGMWVSHEEALDYGAKPFTITREHKVYQDISKHPAYNHSIIFSAFQFAALCGFKVIYLVGCDCYPKPYDTLIDIWKLMKEAYPSIKTYCVNSIGLQGVFEDYKISIL